MSMKPIVSGAAFEVGSLAELKREARTDPTAGLRSAAKQMEGIFVQMMLKSMRDAAPKDSLMHSQSSDMFTSMYDQQLSQDIADRGELGFADMMLRQFGAQVAPPAQTVGANSVTYQLTPNERKEWNHVPMRQIAQSAAGAAPTTSSGRIQRDFISRLLGPAISAAKESGIPHQLIVAQAALESGWGNREIKTPGGRTTHNLFGIKATADWKGESTLATTTEYIDGVKKKVKAAFRVYPSYSAALADYASLLKCNPRYESVTRSRSPEHAAHALQKGGYATDPAYANKLIKIIGQVKGVVAKGISAYKDDISSLF